MNELVFNGASTTVANPFGAITSAPYQDGIGKTQAASRELAETQAQIFLAKQFPRDQRRATENVLTACQRPGLASVAVYSFSKGKRRQRAVDSPCGRDRAQLGEP